VIRDPCPVARFRPVLGCSRSCFCLFTFAFLLLFPTRSSTRLVDIDHRFTGDGRGAERRTRLSTLARCCTNLSKNPCPKMGAHAVTLCPKRNKKICSDTRFRVLRCCTNFAIPTSIRMIVSHYSDNYRFGSRNSVAEIAYPRARSK